MKINKLIWTGILSFAVLFNAVAKDAIHQNEVYDIYLTYTDSTYPGDAVFLKMVFKENKKLKKKDKLATSAKAKIAFNDKILFNTKFYTVPEKLSKTKNTFIAALPLSSYAKTGTYDLTVIYSYEGEPNMEFTVPVEVNSKDFVEETIPLNAQNTEIKTNTSPERMSQIEKLNGILGTINEDAVYQITPFAQPTTITRRTSFFADRRTFAYSNGKSSTSLHYGIDFGCPKGTHVTSCAAGKVVLAENRISTGYSAVIEHLPGLYSLYYHMDELKVKEGDIINMGDLIGLSGATGLATGPHLHWEIRLFMNAINPDQLCENFLFAPVAAQNK